MKKRSYRLVSILLALMLVICLIPATVFAEEETTTYEDGTYKVTGITSSFRMFNSLIVADSCSVVIKNGAATLVIYTNSDARYAEIMLGKYSEKIKTGEEEGIKGFYNDTADEEAGTKGLTYVIPIEDNEAFLSFPDGGSVLYVILRYKKGYSEDHDGDWYKPSNDVTVTVTGIEKVSDDTTLPTGEYPDDGTDPEEPEEPTVSKLAYSGDELGFFKENLSDKFGMLTPQDGSYTAIDGDNVVIHIVPKNTTVYNGWHWGAITDELTKDVAFNADGTIDLKLAAADYCGYASPVAPIKVKDGKTTGDQYYLAVPAADKLRTMAEVQADLDVAAPVEKQIAAIGEVTLESEEAITAARAAYDKLTDAQKKLVSNLATLTAAEEALKALKDAEAAAHIELTITNNTSMFKVVTAYVETAEDGTKTLVFALSGKSYENLFKGTYEEAKANGSDKTKWIKGTTNADGKLEFRLPISDSDTYIPLVSISNTYLAKYEAGENPIERAFYPRQIEIDLDAKTLVAGDYESAKDLTIINNVKMFKPASATLTTVGGPNSNNYSATLNLVMGSDSFDKAYIGTKDEAAAATEGVIAIDGSKTFALKLMWIKTAGDPDSITNLMTEPIIISFHSVAKDAWYEREAIVSESKGTLTFNDVQEEDDDVVKIVSAKDKASDPVHWTKGNLTEDQKLTKKIAVDVNPDIETEDVIDDIIWQRDVTVPEGTEFPVTIEFEIKDAKKGDIYYFYHFNGEKWEVVGKSTDGKATITFDKLSPNAVVKTSNPDTGDSANAFLWGAAAVICIAAAAVLVVCRRREEN